MSIANAANTAYCKINAMGDLSSITAQCKNCTACDQVNLCKADDAGVYSSASTCDNCVQCTDTSDSCGPINGRNGQQDGGHGNPDYRATCQFNKCIQCNSSKLCKNAWCCWDKQTNVGEAWTCQHGCPGI